MFVHTISFIHGRQERERKIVFAKIEKRSKFYETVIAGENSEDYYNKKNFTTCNKMLYVDCV